MNNFHVPIAARLYQHLRAKSESPLLFHEINSQDSAFSYFL